MNANSKQALLDKYARKLSGKSYSASSNKQKIEVRRRAAQARQATQTNSTPRVRLPRIGNATRKRPVTAIRRIPRLVPGPSGIVPHKDYTTQEKYTAVMLNACLHPTVYNFIPSCYLRSPVPYVVVRIYSQFAVALANGSTMILVDGRGFVASGGGTGDPGLFSYFTATTGSDQSASASTITTPAPSTLLSTIRPPIEVYANSGEFCVGPGELRVRTERTDLTKNFPLINDFSHVRNGRLYGRQNQSSTEVAAQQDLGLSANTAHYDRRIIRNAGAFHKGVANNVGSTFPTLIGKRDNHAYISMPPYATSEGGMEYLLAKASISVASLLGAIDDFQGLEIVNDTGASVSIYVSAMTQIAVPVTEQYQMTNGIQSPEEALERVDPCLVIAQGSSFVSSSPQEAHALSVLKQVDRTVKTGNGPSVSVPLLLSAASAIRSKSAEQHVEPTLNQSVVKQDHQGTVAFVNKPHKSYAEREEEDEARAVQENIQRRLDDLPGVMAEEKRVNDARYRETHSPGYQLRHANDASIARSMNGTLWHELAKSSSNSSGFDLGNHMKELGKGAAATAATALTQAALKKLMAAVLA